MGDKESECAGFEFFSNFDSANLAKVEFVPAHADATQITATSNTARAITEIPGVEFNIWTKPDCFTTEFENANRTWFYFGIRANSPGLLVKLNMVDLNRQSKMYSQGMAPVYRIVPGKIHWERIRDKPTYTIIDDIFTLSFKYKTPENIQSIMYFAFTYPYPYVDLVHMLVNIDNRFTNSVMLSKDDIYYHREVVCFSLDGRRVELLTISSYHNISSERETRLKNLFPEQHVPRPHRFVGKKIIFVSARVHPGETPSSFVLNGLLNLLVARDDSVAITLRRLYVFKLIPMLNPDGVARGHYRTDTRGVNLNRMYLNPSSNLHPSIYAARSLIRYYHFGYEKDDDNFDDLAEILNGNVNDNEEDDRSSVGDRPTDSKLSNKVSHMTLEENKKNDDISELWCTKCKTNIIKLEDTMPGISSLMPTFNHSNPLLSTGKGMCRNCGTSMSKTLSAEMIAADDATNKCQHGDHNVTESGIYMYLDMHGHASKKGIFMYGNHFEEFEKNVECMLLPKIMSLNNHNFHFTACNFTERNMYLRDRRDGMSREGSGRVAVLKLTGLVKSYTLECNYNTGRLVNNLPIPIRDTSAKTNQTLHVPPKYTPHVFEEVGKAIGSSILDLTGHNPNTRLPNSQFHSLNGLRDWLRIHCVNELGETRCTAARFKLKNSTSHHTQGKSLRVKKTRSTSAKGPKKMMAKSIRSTSVPIERKENVYETHDALLNQPSCSNTMTVPHTRPKSFNTMRNKKGMKLKASTSNEKIKLNANMRLLGASKQKIKVDITSKLQTIKEKPKATEEVNEDGRVKLREICFIKSGEGKRMIAKYKAKDSGSKGSEDNLIVAWDTGKNPQVFSHKTKGEGPDVKPMVSDAGPSKSNCFRVHHFAKISSGKLNKRNKRPLRRLTSTNDTPAKLEKLKKRKILKAA